MMKKRKSVILLFPLVCVIWGIVIWEITVSLDKTPDKSRNTEYRNPVVFTEEDSVRADYPDPFLKTVVGDKPSDGERVRPADFFSLRAVSQAAAPPAFLFRGVLKRGRREYVLLESGGRQEIVTVGCVIDGFRVVRAVADSVVLVKGNGKYILKR